MATSINTISILGAGWLGLPLGKSLLADGYRVKGATTRTARLPEIEAAGLSGYQIVVSAGQISGNRPNDFFTCDLCILSLPPGRRQPEVETRYPQQVERVLKQLNTGHAPRLLFFSTTGIYGDHNAVVYEADKPDPRRPGAKAVAAAEALLQKQLGDRLTILRLAGLVGGDRHPGRFLAGRKGLPNGDALVNLVHREDVIGIVQAVLKQGAWGTIFNVCADKHPTRGEFYTRQALRLGLEPPQFLDAGPVSYKIVSNEKVKRQLGYTFQWPDPDLF